ncbi:MAG: DUF1801 domain-containing protein [Methanobacterium sp.]|nr:DUF1801 domain-containing protein [Methanobacterium sp.]
MVERVDVDEYLSKYPDEMAEIALELRKFLLKTVPDLNEVIKWNNLFYELNGPVCAILIHKAHINLEFPRGREIAETGYPLEGTGKNMRHLKIKNPDDIHALNLPEIIKKAIELNSN